MDAAEKKKLRTMVADLFCAAGCSCCRNEKEWEAAQAALAKRLGVPKHPDGLGYNFNKFASKRRSAQ